jgi:Tol biopolymer transport system component
MGLLPPGTEPTTLPVLQVTKTSPAPVPGPTQTITTPSPQPTFTPAIPVPTAQGGGSGELAFVSTRTGSPQIYLMNADGSNVRQETNAQDGACQPDWSPDGLMIVYISPCLQKQDTYQGSSLYILDIATKNITQLPASLGGDFEPAWSPDGKRIAFTSLRDGFMEIYMINLDTKQETRLTKAQSIVTGVFARQPAWNPFGTQIAYVQKRQGVSQIWVTTDGDANLPKPNAQLVQSGSKAMDSLPVWTPDGQFVIFDETNFEGNAPFKLMSMRYEDRASMLAVPLNIEPLPIVDASFSPDGQWIAYESWPLNPVNVDVYISSISGANRTRLTTDPGSDFDPVWRPAGKR